MVSSPLRRIKEIQDYQKIAAGEVIERPASVVKELIENSIDAGAKKITINIQNFGKSLIQVIDDGVGIHPEDVEIAFLPHTSNKIRSADELVTLKSLGFRGEALYSICSISKTELITKTRSSSHGIKIELVGGVVKSCTQTAAALGTNIKVRDLFFNTPVRYKFLKSDRVEMGHITDIVSRYILGYPEINFKLMQDSTPILSSPSSSDPVNAIFDVYGKDFAKNSVFFRESHNLFTIEGYIGDPTLAQSTSHNTTVFINGRYVISPTVHEAMKFAYKSYIMIHKHPFYVLFLTIDPSKVDFNIHPTKKIVRFEEEETILSALSEVTRSVVNQKFGQSTITSQLDQSISSSSKTIETWIEEKSPSENHLKNNLSTSAQSPLVQSSSKFTSQSQERVSSEAQIATPHKTKALPLQTFAPNLISKQSHYFLRNEWIQTKSFPKMRLISESGQLKNVYFVFEGEEGFYILDMHAADERINYEKEMKAYLKGGMHRQRLIIPFTIEVPINMKEYLLDTISEVAKFGFEVNHLGGTTFTLHTIPTILKEVQDTAILTDICLEIIEMGKQTSFSQSVEKILKYIACHESIRGGDMISDPEFAKKLLITLSLCENPHHCAHGRPTMLFFSWSYLEKEFHR
ncbi:MAG: DNA mismatch repair endonuclease MutL [Candidatus Lokiarchaeota archaeon]|nr:DNA mismatch repair endonuclease MutL [Candidatus Lokiarchaeota archaeon]